MISSPLTAEATDWPTRAAEEASAAFCGDQVIEVQILARALHELLAALSCELAPAPVAPSGGESCFLGAGANGCVFRVRRVAAASMAAAEGAAASWGAAAAAVASSGPATTAGVTGGIGATPTSALAIKVVLTPPRTHHSVQAAMEYAALLDAAKSWAPVVAPIAGTLMSLACGVGYLLQDLGTPARCDSEEQCYAAFVALQRLHACSIQHGDARIDNLLAVNRRGRHELLWIDFRPAPARRASYTVEEIALFSFYDCVLLAASILEVGDGVLPPEVTPALRTYTPGMSAAGLRALSDAVFSAKRPL